MTNQKPIDSVNEVKEYIERISKSLKAQGEAFQLEYAALANTHEFCLWPMNSIGTENGIEYRQLIAVIPRTELESGQSITAVEAKAKYPHKLLSVTMLLSR